MKPYTSEAQATTTSIGSEIWPKSCRTTESLPKRSEAGGTLSCRKVWRPHSRPAPETPASCDLIGEIDYSDTWSANSPTRPAATYC